MFAVGHLALGYILGKTTSKSLRVNLNIPLVLTVSILPDIDLLIRELIPALEHRGPTHSAILILLLSLPAFIIRREKAAPYFMATAQHSIGDFVAGGGVQLLWPLDSSWFGIGIQIMSLANILIEWTLFLVFITMMFRTKDLRILFQPHMSNMLLTVPVFTVLLPTLLSFPLSVPSELIIPHVVYLVLFAASIPVGFQHTLRKLFQ